MFTNRSAFVHSSYMNAVYFDNRNSVFLSFSFLFSFSFTSGSPRRCAVGFCYAPPRRVPQATASRSSIQDTSAPCGNLHRARELVKKVFLTSSQTRSASLGSRRNKLRIPRPAANGRSRSLRCCSSPNVNHFAGFTFGYNSF